jgi:hypothetical protein
MNASEAKEFVISRIVAEARSQAVSLSETEWQMLYWSEIHPPPNIPDLGKLAERFDAECDSDQYEMKIRALAEAARKRDSIDEAQAKRWEGAIDALSEEDHYINVMLPGFSSSVGVAGRQHRTRDVILYLAIALSIVVVITIYALYTSH